MPSRPAGPPAARQALSPADGLAQLSFLIQGILERRAREQDLSIIQIRLLGVLRDRRPTMNELARLLGLDKSSVTGLVDRAEGGDLVVRAPPARSAATWWCALPPRPTGGPSWSASPTAADRSRPAARPASRRTSRCCSGTCRRPIATRWPGSSAGCSSRTPRPTA